MGSRTTFSLRLTSRNTGDSSTRSRTHSATPISRKLARNGMRQPHDSNCSSGRRPTSRKEVVPSTLPTRTPVWANEPKKPRRAAGACSTSSVDAPPNSAPAPSPWQTRSRVRMTGAHTPMAA
jgi:hypothetical protein